MELRSIRQGLILGAIGIAAISVFINVFLMWMWSIPGVVEEPLEEYDYIIVGAGTAGCVLARRLSERCDCSVLVVEVGTVAPWISQVPLVAPALQLTTADWGYKTVPQMKSHKGMHQQRSLWPRGRALGGSSAINYLLHMWGSRYDFDSSLAEVIDDGSWNFDSVLPYFKKTEQFTRPSGEPVLGDRGTTGPMPVQELHGVPTEVAEAFLNGASTLGLKTVDLNGESETGIMLSQSNIRNGQRVSAFDAYLKPILGSYDTNLLLNTLVTKVLFEGKKAVGVEVKNVYTGKVRNVHVTKEVILSAGALGSPHILLLSGVGPKQQLRNMSIPVVADVPGVGENLQDHLSLPMYFHLNAPVSITTAKTRSVRHVWDYFISGTGFLGTTGMHVVARASLSSKIWTVPDVYYLQLNVGSVNEDIFKKISNMKDDVFHQSFPEAHNDSKEGYVLMPICSIPKSKGNLVLASKDPFISPMINPNYLDKNEDVECFLKAIRFGARLGTTATLAALGSRLHLPAYRNCARFKQSLEDDEYLKCWVRTGAITSYHPVGTCSMGHAHDQMAVVDTQFRVRGVKNLRVVDASVLPKLTSGTPNAVVMMLAEKAADIIVE